jgi:hypothetical protein
MRSLKNAYRITGRDHEDIYVCMYVYQLRKISYVVKM